MFLCFYNGYLMVSEQWEWYIMFLRYGECMYFEHENICTFALAESTVTSQRELLESHLFYNTNDLRFINFSQNRNYYNHNYF